jgi:NAD(P)-dependent dehydrogenase (short-subunit alcohol dehydrogenase family)
MSSRNWNFLWGIAAAGAALAGYKALRRNARSYDFAGKMVLITGGSRGLGLVLARQFLDLGARIAICARDADELSRAAMDERLKDRDVLPIVCDVRNRDDAQRAVETAGSRFGPVDVLINDAGVIQVGPLELQTRLDFEEAMAVHFWGPFNMIEAVLPEMRRRREGRIVNISSIGGKIAVPHLVPYCASKFALSGLSSGMRSELAKENISITSVYPGLMRSGSHINALFKGQNEKEYAWFSIADALPPISVSAESAARQIIRTTRRGDAELIVSVQAKLAAKFNALFPEITADLLALGNTFLPEPGGIGTDLAAGLESESSASPSFLTRLADSASLKNNELKPTETLG